MNIRKFLKSEDSEFGVRIVLGGAIPLFLLSWLGYPREGLMVMIGSTYISGIDIPAELPRKLRLMSYSLISTPLVFMILSLAYPYPLPLYLFLTAFIFLFSFLAPFSYHFGKVAFMSNLAIMLSLSFASTLSDPIEIFQTGGLLVAGGVWYMAFASLMHFIQRPVQVTRRVIEVLVSTSDYFTTRSHLFDPETDKDQLFLELADKQASLTDSHEKVRALLMKDFDYSRQTNSRMGRMLHFFASLIDLFDEALATSWKIQEATEIFKDNAINNLFRDINGSIANLLQLMVDHLENSTDFSDILQIRKELQVRNQLLRNELNTMRQNLKSNQDSGNVYHAYKPIQLYIEKQLDTLEYMIMILEGRNRSDIVEIKGKDLPHFETRDQLRLDQIRSHLTFKSGYFRYALRVTTTAMTAYFIAQVLGFQNPNWALFTVLVILKPGYRVAQKRLVWRVVGTTIGVLVAYGLFWMLHPDQLLSSVVFLVAFFGGFAFLNRNYTIASGFFTIYILFLYAFLDRNMETSAIFRFSNTLLAAILSVFALRLLFPYWENRSIKYFLTQSLQATRNYLHEIYEQMKSPGYNLTSYRIARKDAQLAMGEFTHAHQRIMAEPRRKRGNTSEIEVWIQHTSNILAVCSNLGLFLRREPDYQLNQKYLQKYFDWFLSYFQDFIDHLGDQEQSSLNEHSLKIMRELKKDHQRLKKEINLLASGYTEVYISTIHEYFIVHELVTLYHLVERLEDTTSGSETLSLGSDQIVYN